MMRIGASFKLIPRAAAKGGTHPEENLALAKRRAEGKILRWDQASVASATDVRLNTAHRRIIQSYTPCCRRQADCGIREIRQGCLRTGIRRQTLSGLFTVIDFQLREEILQRQP